MRQIAICGKGGIGKFTKTQNLVAGLAEAGKKVMIIGCDPKADSTRLMLHAKAQTTVMDLARERGSVEDLELGGLICNSRKVDKELEMIAALAEKLCTQLIHFVLRDNVVQRAANCSTCGVKSNVKSITGVMTARGCAYAGSKGVVWGPIRDMVHLSHGPVGCGYYSWSTRRNLAQGTPGVDNFVPFQFTSGYRERDIVYGGAQRLEMIKLNMIH